MECKKATLKLKPCPFCGQEPKLQEDIRYPRPECEAKKAYEVFCVNKNCPICEADNFYSLSKEEAVRVWNKRADNSPKKTEEIEENPELKIAIILCGETEKIEDCKNCRCRNGYCPYLTKASAISKYFQTKSLDDLKRTEKRILKELEITKTIVRKNYGISEAVGIDVAMRKIKEIFDEVIN